MTEMQCLKIRIKAGQTEYARQWIAGLAARRDEVQVALAAEGITIESIFLNREPDGDYLLLYQRAASLVKASEVFIASELPLDVETKQFILDGWESVQLLDVLFDAERAG